LLRRFTRLCVRLVERYLPDPFLFAVLLTFIVFIMGLVWTPSGPLEMIRHWGDGFWGLLEFTMQMVLILVLGHALARAPLVERGLRRVAGMARDPGKALMLTTFVATVASWISWGFGLVVGALFAREVAKRVPDVDYRVLVAGAYSGFLVWHGGLSGSVPLKLATDDQFGVMVPTSETLFAAFNLVPVIVLAVTLPFLIRWMQPTRPERVTVRPEWLQDDASAASLANDSVETPAERLETSAAISLVTAAMGLIFILWFFIEKGFQLDLNIINFIFLMAGIALHRTPRRYVAAISEAVRKTGGIVLQFPFYAGIMGMMASSGLGEKISELFVSISNETTFPLFTFLSAGLVNLFVPSGGGQWAVQGPIMLAAGEALGVDPAKTAMAVAWGDAWTNMIQPFWALPLLAIARLKARDIMGYCLVVLLYSGLVIGLSFLLL
jgi:short-chain fatty acids transporter